ALAEAAEQGMVGAKQAEWFADLAPEQENLLAALDGSARFPDGPRKGLRLANGVQRLWSQRGQFRLGHRAMRDAVQRDQSGEPSAERAMGLVRLSGFALIFGEWADARAGLSEALAYYRAVGDRKGVARALSGLGVAAMYQNNVDDAYE